MKYNYYPEDQDENVYRNTDYRRVTPLKVVITILIIASYVLLHLFVVNYTGTKRVLFNSMYVAAALGLFFCYESEGNDGIFYGLFAALVWETIFLLFFGLIALIQLIG